MDWGAAVALDAPIHEVNVTSPSSSSSSSASSSRGSSSTTETSPTGSAMASSAVFERPQLVTSSPAPVPPQAGPRWQTDSDNARAGASTSQGTLGSAPPFVDATNPHRPSEITSNIARSGKSRALFKAGGGEGDGDEPGASPATTIKTSTPRRASHSHVDIVSYPPASLIRLIASLLEQITRANDALNLRNSSSSSSLSSSGHLPERDAFDSDAESAFRHGHFDAAPLNSPVTPLSRSTSRDVRLDSFLDASFEVPVTPGADLLTQVPGGAGNGVEGFMPSLGGMHSPVPLARRRGSSFTKHKASSPMPSSTVAAAAGDSALSSDSHPSTSLFTASSVALASPTSTLCFHARNVPAISIEAYLLRILKYCPTTNEVFLSLLVYFDRMARISLEARKAGPDHAGATSQSGDVFGPNSPGVEERFFTIDSFNVHRLLIAGVTVASKFFSDVFYTNSRYAKVGGLPLTELNQLELQFLLLNDFRLKVPLDEMQSYADQLLLFWVGRDVPATVVAPPPPPPLLDADSASPSLQSLPIKRRSSDEGSRPTAVAAAAVAMSIDNPSSLAQRQQHMPLEPRRRPRSIRSQPSSSGTSVTSTITPGTPSTERASASESEQADSDDDRDHEYDDCEDGVSRGGDARVGDQDEDGVRREGGGPGSRGGGRGGRRRTDNDDDLDQGHMVDRDDRMDED